MMKPAQAWRCVALLLTAMVLGHVAYNAGFCFSVLCLVLGVVCTFAAFEEPRS